MASITVSNLTTTTQTTTNTVYDKGCGSTPNCSTYNAWTSCIVDLYRGVSTNQIIYLLDKNGKPIDLDRIDKVDVMLYNEYGCAVMSVGHGLSIEGMQTTYMGDLFKITPDNFQEMGNKYFDLYNVRVTNDDPELICPDDSKAIILGTVADDEVQFGQIIFNPISYNGDLYLKVEPNEENTGECICKVNGLPERIQLDENNKLINVLDESKDVLITLASFDADFNQTILMLDSISLSCTTGFTDKGMLKIYYSGNRIPKIAGRLTAEIIITFNDEDDEEKGATKIISCFPMANVHHSILSDTVTPDEDDDNPVYDGMIYKVVDVLPAANWNTMNTLYLLESKNPREKDVKVEYITVKKKINNGYSYYWERLGETYDLVTTQYEDNTASINLTNNDYTDTIIIKHGNTISDNGSVIEYDVDGNVITTNITKIDGGVL